MGFCNYGVVLGGVIFIAIIAFLAGLIFRKRLKIIRYIFLIIAGGILSMAISIIISHNKMINDYESKLVGTFILSEESELNEYAYEDYKNLTLTVEENTLSIQPDVPFLDFTQAKWNYFDDGDIGVLQIYCNGKTYQVNGNHEYWVFYHPQPEYGKQVEMVKFVRIKEESTILRKTLENPRILVLPSFDKIANRGISPNIREYLENELKKSKSITLIEFPFKKLMGIPYQNVYDKKYCQPIVDKVDCDIVVMSRLDFVKQTGYMPRDGWNLSIRIYNVNTDIQIDSKLKVDSLSPPGIKKVLGLTEEILLKEIESTVANSK